MFSSCAHTSWTPSCPPENRSPGRWLAETLPSAVSATSQYIVPALLYRNLQGMPALISCFRFLPLPCHAFATLPPLLPRTVGVPYPDQSALKAHRLFPRRTPAPLSHNDEPVSVSFVPVFPSASGSTPGSVTQTVPLQTGTCGTAPSQTLWLPAPLTADTCGGSVCTAADIQFHQSGVLPLRLLFVSMPYQSCLIVYSVPSAPAASHASRPGPPCPGACRRSSCRCTGPAPFSRSHA